MNRDKIQKLFDDVFANTEIALDPSVTKFSINDINVLFFSSLYTKYCVSALSNCRLTPDIAAQIAKMYMMYQTEMVASIMILNRSYKLKDIRDFAHKFRAPFPKFTDEIEYYCKNKKSNKCILMYNYTYLMSTKDELRDVDILYHELANRGITLIDAIRVIRSVPTLLISPINDSGYKRTK